ncbi:MAG: tRNA epoxyqueuosine(34) reductase QueG [Bacteroidales bacterium]|nr:tRNA epoxyqueuosine(34) reductase QueG [Bacteroidales bacterium]
MNGEAKQQSATKEQKIKSLALEIGFDACGVSSASFLAEEDSHIKHWLAEGMNGEMAYMERNLEKRLDPRILVPNAKSVISVLINYYSGSPRISTESPKISRYALSHDYHDVVRDKLYLLLELIQKEFGQVEGRVFVDSAPVLEKTWAVRTGLGWIGKNSLLINPKLGSYTFIGELIVDLEVEPSIAEIRNHCGTCTRCMDACPTGAIVSPSVIDSRKCISYLTIEKKSALTDDEVKMLNGWCFGCDICQEVCPWNSKITISKCEELMSKQEILSLSPEEMRTISNENFNMIFNNTPLLRTGWKKIVTNSNQ